MKQLIGRAVVSLLSLTALSIHASSAPVSPVLPDAAVWALGAFALWMLFGAWLKTPDAFCPKRLWGLAALFAGVMTLGESFSALGNAEWVSSHKAEALLFFVGRIPLYFAAMRLFVNLLEKPAAPARAKKAVVMGGWLLLCWLPWYICLFPGTVSNDSISQMKIILGLAPWSNANPICQTALVDAFRQIALWLGGSADLAVALYCMLQAVLMAWLLGSLLCEMARSGASGHLVWGSFAFYALCPVFPVFAFCVGKDTNFAMAVLFLALEVWRILHHPGPVRIKRIAGICVASAACVVLRNPGIYLVLLTLAAVLIHGLRRKNWQLPLCGAVCAAAVFVLLHLVIIPSLHIAPMPETEEYSIPLQQVARVACADALTPEQASAVDGVLQLDKVREAYNGELSDPVKDLWRTDATAEAKAAFWKAWPQIVMDHPMTCVSATFHNTYAYLYPGYVSTIKPTLLIGDQSTRTASVAGSFDYSVNPLSAKLKALTDTLNRQVLFRVLVSPGLYGWLTLLCAVWLWYRRNRRSLLCAIPALFTLAGCMLSAVNGYFRYAMPLYLSAPFLIWLMSRSRQN